MKETGETRLNRLMARRTELYDQRKKIHDSGKRNVEHKLAMVDREIRDVQNKIVELHSVENG